MGSHGEPVAGRVTEGKIESGMVDLWGPEMAAEAAVVRVGRQQVEITSDSRGLSQRDQIQAFLPEGGVILLSRLDPPGHSKEGGRQRDSRSLQRCGHAGVPRQPGEHHPHIFLSKADRLDYPDQMVFDLDPQSEDFELVRSSAWSPTIPCAALPGSWPGL